MPTLQPDLLWKGQVGRDGGRDDKEVCVPYTSPIAIDKFASIVQGVHHLPVYQIAYNVQLSSCGIG